MAPRILFTQVRHSPKTDNGNSLRGVNSDTDKGLSYSQCRLFNPLPLRGRSSDLRYRILTNKIEHSSHKRLPHPHGPENFGLRFFSKGLRLNPTPDGLPLFRRSWVPIRSNIFADPQEEKGGEAQQRLTFSRVFLGRRMAFAQYGRFPPSGRLTHTGA